MRCMPSMILEWYSERTSTMKRGPGGQTDQSRITPTPRGMGLCAPRSGDGGAALGSPSSGSTSSSSRTIYRICSAALPIDLHACAESGRQSG